MTEQSEETEAPKKFAFFVGCTIRVRIPYIEKLARDIFGQLGVELIDLDFSCCPTARIVQDVDMDSWLFIAARNLAVAEKAGLPLLSMCTGCTLTLVEAKHALKDIDTQKRINERLGKLGLQYSGTSDIKFYAQLLHEMREELPVTRKLPINIASHPGCHIIRPSKRMKFDDPENPVKLDELIETLGADAVNYPKKALCCGFPIHNIDPDAAEQMMKEKITSIDADCMTVLCPTCFEYYELRQTQIAHKMGFQPLMVLHFLQLLGLAIGYSLEDIGYEHLKYRDESFGSKI